MHHFFGNREVTGVKDIWSHDTFSSTIIIKPEKQSLAMARVPLDVLYHTLRFVPDVDHETLKACSVAIPPLRLDLLKAVFSQLTITFKFNKKDHRKQIRDRLISFLEILMVNPSYAKLICNLRIDLSDVDYYLHDGILIGSMGIALSECTSVHRLSLVSERRGMTQWSVVPSAIRAEVDDMLRSGKLCNLELQSIAIPWTTLLAPGPEPLSLALKNGEDIIIDLPPPNTRQILHLKVSGSSLDDLVRVEEFKDWPMFDFKDLLTLEVNWYMSFMLNDLRKLLSQAMGLRSLSVEMGCDFEGEAFPFPPLLSIEC